MTSSVRHIWDDLVELVMIAVDCNHLWPATQHFTVAKTKVTYDAWNVNSSQHSTHTNTLSNNVYNKYQKTKTIKLYVKIPSTCEYYKISIFECISATLSELYGTVPSKQPSCHSSKKARNTNGLQNIIHCDMKSTARQHCQLIGMHSAQQHCCLCPTLTASGKCWVVRKPSLSSEQCVSTFDRAVLWAIVRDSPVQ